MPCIAFDYLTTLRYSLWRYATSAEVHGGQMQHKKKSTEWSCWFATGYPLMRSHSPRT